MSEPSGIRPATPAGAVLAEYAPELYSDPRLMPLLRRLMHISCRLTEAIGGSISIVEYPGQRYTKIAERGTSCRLGQSFPLYEGVTGQVMACRRPVVLAAYRDIATGHLPLGHPARDGAVAAIPIWWRGEVVGVNVVFAGCARPFTTAEIDQLEVVTQLAAPGITTAAGRELSLTHFGQRASVGAAGAPTPGAQFPDRHRGDAATPSVAELALELTALGERAGIYRDGPGERLNVAVVREGSDLHLITPGRVSDLREAGSRPAGPAGWEELVDTDGGTDVRPYSAAVEATPLGRSLVGEDSPGRSPFSPRERQVAALLARGLSDRSIAHELLISRKTVEKHVGAVIRKTGTSSRTAAVMCALDRGWFDDEASAVRLSLGKFPHPLRRRPGIDCCHIPVTAPGQRPRRRLAVPVVSLKETLDQAFTGRYGVPAINIIDDLSISAVLAAAVQEQSPVILQTSVKTVKSYGRDQLFGVFSALVRDIDVPVSLHLDHCPDRAVISSCLEGGWNSVLFDAHELDVAENRLQTSEVVKEARRHGASVEGEIEGIQGVEDDLGSDEASMRQSLEVAVDFIKRTGVDCFAPAIGNAHGQYVSTPVLDHQRVSDLVEATGIPMALHGGTGLSEEQFQDLIARGCAKVNISTALKEAYMKSGLEFLRGAEEKGKWDPPSLFRHQAAAVTQMAREHMRVFGSSGCA